MLVDGREAALAFPKGDLELSFCPSCGFIQNDRFDPRLATYTVACEDSQAFSGRFMRFVDETITNQDAKYGLAGRTVLEIGCGKGEFLARLVERTGARGIGIDPAYVAGRVGVPAAERLTFIQDFYGPAYAHLEADYVCCRHTLEHIPDVGAFVSQLRRAIGDRPDVVVLFELPDTERVLAERAFWDIYYEHCSYFTAGSLGRLFRRAGFELLDLYKVYDGQYLMIEARPAIGGGMSAPLPIEEPPAVTAEWVRGFEIAVRGKIEALRSAVRGWALAGKRVVLWGSGSKAVACLTTLGIGDEVAGVIDINPHRVGKHLAGPGHRIEAPESLVGLRPDVVLIMNPIYRAEIQAQLQSLGLAPELHVLD